MAPDAVRPFHATMPDVARLIVQRRTSVLPCQTATVPFTVSEAVQRRVARVSRAVAVG